MKNLIVNLLLLSLISVFTAQTTYAQFEIDTVDKKKVYVINTNDGGTFVGQITYFDSKEVIIITKELGEVSIPKYQIKSVKELEEGQLNAKGEYIPNEVFSTRYFITTNGLPMEKGENYIQWNLFGPDLQFGVAKNFGVGVMTSWFGIPLIGTMKYSIPVNEKLNFGVGALIGTGSWVSINSGGVLPFAVMTVGDRRANVNISAGYAALFIDGDNSSRPLLSVAGMTKVGKKVSLVFDSFIFLEGPTQAYSYWNGSAFVTSYRRAPGGALLIPGIRIQTEPNSAFQFGFGGLLFDGELLPAPLPMVQWYRKI
jgi:hypothetical protein